MYKALIMPFFFLWMFNHTHYPQSQSLSVLVTVLVAFAQIPLGLHGVWSWRIWGDGPPGLGGGDCSLALFLHLQLVKINSCFSALPTSQLSSLISGPCHMEITTLPGRAIQETFSPLLLLQGAPVAARGSFFVSLSPASAEGLDLG